MSSSPPTTLALPADISRKWRQDIVTRHLNVARAAFSPRPNHLAMGQVVVGTPTPACLRALGAGKVYYVPHRWRSTG